ncbi:restriction endonuclease subunit S [Mogibacterium diversum]
MAEKSKKPAIRFAGFTDAWEQRKLGEIYEVNNERNAGQYSIEKTLSIATMTFNEQGNGADVSSLSKYKVLRVGDLAFEGHTNKEFRYGRFVLNNLENGIMSPRFTTLRPIIKQDFNFWEYYIHSERVMRSKLVNATKSGTMMNELVPVDLFRQLILLPKMPEQTKIGGYFKHLDNLITLHQRKYDKLVNVKKAMLEKMFPKDGADVPEIRFKGFTEAWEQRKLGELSSSFEYGLNAASKEFDGKNKYIRITDIDDDSHDFNQKDITSPDIDLSNADNFKLREGDILFARTGASVGKTYIYKSSHGLVYYAGFLIRARIKEEYNPEFVFQNTLTNGYQKFIKVTSMRSGQPGINALEYYQFELMVPEKAEQSKIGKYFRQLDNLITLHQRKLEKLKNLKKACLEKMFV